MASVVRHCVRVSRTRLTITPSFQLASRRWNGDYGSKQSGHEQGVDQKNPMKHMEHPGPESPASKGSSSGGSSAGSSPSSSSGSDSSGASQSSNTSTSHAEPSNGAQPKLNKANQPSGDENTDVKKHNEAMENRSEKTVNQRGQDGEVEKGYWSGDVGAGKTNKR